MNKKRVQKGKVPESDKTASGSAGLPAASSGSGKASGDKKPNSKGYGFEYFKKWDSFDVDGEVRW